MLYDELRALSLLDGFTDEQVADLAASGAEVTYEPGEHLFVEGRPADDWWVLLEGKVEMVRQIGHEEVVVVTMEVPGQWAGGFRAWDEQGVYLATGRGAEPGRMLRVPAQALKDRAIAWFPFAMSLIEGCLLYTSPSPRD